MLPTLPTVIGVILVVFGAGLSVFAFPPFGPGWLIVPGISLFLAALHRAPNRRTGLLLGGLYGAIFFSGLMWWLSELGLIAAIPLFVVQGAFLAVYGWWLSGYNDRSTSTWYLLALGGWAVMELIRYHFPVGGLEWGAAGYALSDHFITRFAAAYVGTTGLTMAVVMLSALIVFLSDRWTWKALIPLASLIAFVLLVGLFDVNSPRTRFEFGPVVVVQGSTPCPFEHCVPDERLKTFQQHLKLTETVDSAKLVIWSEGSTGSFNADPVLNPDIRAEIGGQARRLHAWFLVGGDRPVNAAEWINANVVFDPSGEIIGEYRKQHAVPFGEYVPLRPLFDWIPALAAVPLDMIPGKGPVVFDLAGTKMGSVISFEGGFSRYARQHVTEGARFVVVATNEGSYGTTPASDQFIGMTRMRAVELGVPVVHSAVTGRSVFIDRRGGFISRETGLGTVETLSSELEIRSRPSPYVRLGDIVMWASAIMAFVLRSRVRLLVGSDEQIFEED